MTTTLDGRPGSLAELRTSLAQRPNDVELLCAMAQAFLVEGDAAAARGFAARADELAATDPRPVLILAQALLAQGRAEEAAAALTARRAAFGGREGFLLALAQAHAATGNDDSAYRTLHAVLRGPHDHAEAHHALGDLWLARGEAALAAAHVAAAAHGDGATRWDSLADTYGHHLARSPQDVDALLLVAGLALRGDDFVAAGHAYVRALEVGGDDARTLVAEESELWRPGMEGDDPACGGRAGDFVRRGLLLHVLGRKDQAKAAYERACMRAPDHAFARAMLAALNGSLGLPSDHAVFALDAAANAAANAREVEDRATVLQSTPTTIEVASTNVCNIDPPCVQCWKHIDPTHGWLQDDAHHLSRDQLETLAPFVRRSSRVSLHGVGEPLANPHLFESVRWCDSRTAVMFVSNALLFNDARIDRVLQHRVTMIDFSLDAGTADTYRAIRHNDFAKATGNIRRLIEERNRRGLDRPNVVINMCLMRRNVADIPAFVQLAHELGVTSAHLFHMNHGASYRFGWFDYGEQHCDNDPESHDRYVEEGFALAERLGVDLHLSGRRRLAAHDDERRHWGRDLAQERFFCPKPWDSLLVQVNGDVFNCCWQAHPLGNLRHDSLWQVWNGALLQEVRAKTAAGDPHPVCTGSASRCPFLGRE
ncbi:MAG: radical SAM protein [Planctomycetota bacterium]